MYNRYISCFFLIAAFIISIYSYAYAAENQASEYKKLGDSFFSVIDSTAVSTMSSPADRKAYYENIINSNKKAIGFYEKLKNFNSSVANKKLAECYLQIADSYKEVNENENSSIYEKAIENYNKAKSITSSFYKKYICDSPDIMWDYDKSSKEGNHYVYYIKGPNWCNDRTRECYAKISYAYLAEENLQKSFDAVEKLRKYNYDDGFFSFYYPCKLEEQAEKCKDKSKKILMYEKILSLSPDYQNASKIREKLNSLKK